MHELNPEEARALMEAVQREWQAELERIVGRNIDRIQDRGDGTFWFPFEENREATTFALTEGVLLRLDPVTYRLLGVEVIP